MPKTLSDGEHKTQVEQCKRFGKTAMRPLKIAHRGIILVIVPLIVELLFIGVLAKLLLETRSQIWEERRARNVVTAVSILSRQVQTAARTLALYTDTDDERLLKQYEDLRKLVPPEFAELKDLLKDQPADLKDVATLEASVTSAIDILEKCKGSFGGKGGDERTYNRIVFYPQLYRQGLVAERQFDKLLKRYRTREMADRAANDSASNSIALWLSFGVLLNMAIALYLAVSFNRSISGRLNTLIDNTIRLAANKPLNERVQGRDEISELDSVFHRMAEALAEANRVKQEFVAMISHDLRSPLTAVQCTLELIGDGAYGELKEIGYKRVKTAERETERLIVLINNLLDIEKMEANQMVLDLVPTELATLVESATDSIKPLCEAKSITIKTELQSANVLADDNRLMQVLVNLLSNAVKFSSKDSTVEVSIKMLKSAAEVSVRDYGRGIPASQKESIFERWKQTSKEDGKAGKGSGLGLAISRSIVEAHGGTIGFHSVEGEGTTFWLRLPLTENAEVTGDS